MNYSMDNEYIYKNYYAVHKTYPYIDAFTEATKDAQDKYNQAYNKMVTYLDAVIAYEANKENKFLTTWLNKLSQTKANTVLVSELQSFINGPKKDYSKAFQLIEMSNQKLEESVYDENKSFEDNMKTWIDHMQQYNNKFFVESAKKSIASMNDLVNMNIEDIMDKIIQDATNDWMTNFNNGDQSRVNDFNTFMDTYAPTIRDLVYSSSNFKIDNKAPMANLKAYKGQNNSKIATSISAIIVDGLINGLSQEEYEVVFGGDATASTARHTNNLAFFSGKTMAVPTETDIYMTYNADLTPNKDLINEIKAVSTHGEIKQKINERKLENNFIIHYSSKDLSIAALSSKNPTAKIKGEGSFDSKIVGLQEFGNVIGERELIDDIIFKAVNTGEGLMYSKGIYRDEIGRDITSLALSFMFEDFEESIQNQLNGIDGIDHLHIYLITGKYYAMSDILSLLRNQVQNWARQDSSIINVGFKSAPEDYYTLKVKNSNLVGKDRWDEVRKLTIANTKMKVILSAGKLDNLIAKL